MEESCMRRKLLLFLPLLPLVLSGCHHMAASPYEYQFSDNALPEVCVKVSPRSNESLRLTINQTLREQGFEVREVRAFDDDCQRCLHFSFKFAGWNNQISEGSLTYTRVVHGNRYEARAEEKLPDAAFGTPGDDEDVIIRSLLSRIFPQPVPWRE